MWLRSKIKTDKNYNFLRKVAAVVVLLLPTVIFAQKLSPDQQFAAIKADILNYYWGEGEGATYAEADKLALTELISKISVHIEASISNRDVEKNGELQSEYDISFKSFSNATLNGAQVIVLSNAPKSHIVRFISKKAVDKIFEQREDKVRDYVRTAMRCEQRGKIDEALRHYYWGLKLLQSLVEPNKVVLTDNGNNLLLITEIPKRINTILDNLKVSVMDVDEGDVDILITYKGQPVTSLDYTYFDGQMWSPLYSAKDGRGILELRQGMTPDMVQLKYEYEYTSESHIDKEMAIVMEHSRAIPFRKATVPLSEKGKKMGRKEKTKFSDMAAMVSAASTVGGNMTTVENAKPYQAILDKVISAIRTKNYQSVRSLFTNDGWDMFDRLIHYGKARLLPGNSVSFLPMSDRVVARSVPMSFSFGNNNRTFVEDVTFTFGKDYRIESLAFGLGSVARTDIFDRNVGRWPEQSKMVLASFLEDYKTAYALKRLDYIESIFSEDAYIVIGHVLKKPSKKIEGTTVLSKEDVRYTRHTKRDYMRSLERSFKSNQFINIRFANNEILKAGQGGEVYGIQIKQDYYSSTYGDTGYLFILVDINDPDHPIISIRTWQPDRNPNINSMLSRDDPDYGLYGIGNF